MLEKVIRKSTLNKLLKELSAELGTLVCIRKNWLKTVKIAHNKVKKKKVPSSTESVNGIIGCIVVMKLDDEIPKLKKRINRIKKLIRKK